MEVDTGVGGMVSHLRNSSNIKYISSVVYRKLNALIYNAKIKKFKQTSE